MKHRVSNAPKNLTRRFEARYRAQRQGQALLLAVVVMLFVALISAGFLATVAGNLNQTARTSEKNRAIEAAKAGMTYINNRINSSAEGENWRPAMESPIPATSDPNYANYNLPIAQIQGLVSGGYSKFPIAKNDAADAPQFYAKVERIGYDAATRSANGQASEAERAGMLKITVVGLGRTDPNVFHRMVAYRGGYEGAPIGRVARAVSHYDFVKKGVQTGVVSTAAAASDTTLQLSKVEGNFPTSADSNGYWVNIISPTGVVTRALATNFDSTSKVLTVASLPSAVAVNSHVEIAAPLGAQDTNDWTLSPTPTPLPVQLDTTDQTAPASVRANAGVYWQGNAKLLNLRPYSGNITSTTYPLTVEASGMMSVQGNVAAGTTAGTEVSVDSTTGTIDGARVSDGKNRILGDLDTLRQTKPFSPPDLASTENLTRYRGLTRDSKSNLAAYPEAASYGYGQGIYIDNAQDREKIAATPLREMRQKELINLWANAVNGTSTNAADPLEARGLRGWVSHDEFKPRGVQIELFNRVVSGTSVPMIGITRDALTDTGGDIPDIKKAWKNPDGTAKTEYDYYKEFPIDVATFNGVIFAEGNVRIKGNAAGANTSLTVVSLGNIYIEGSLGLDGSRKVLLLARKNVVLNPSRVLSRPEAFTSTTATTAGSVSSLDVFDASNFRVGDYIQVGTVTPPTISTPVSITAKVGNTLTLSSPVALVVGTQFVKITSNPAEAQTQDLSDRFAALSTSENVIQRVITPQTDTTVTPPAVTQVAFRHAGERFLVGSVDKKGSAPPSATATEIRIKQPSAPPATTDPTYIQVADKKISVSSPTESSDLDNTLSTLNSVGVGTNYEMTVVAGYDSVVSRALAGVGNYRPADKATASTAWLLPFGATPNIPLATSVGVTFNGAPLLKGFASVTGSQPQGFGFNTALANNEDPFTTDQAFYIPNPATTAPVAATPENTLPLKSSYDFTPTAVTDRAMGDQLSLKLNDLTGTGLSADTTTAPQVPDYYLFGLRVQSATVTEPGYVFKINAFVYAQTGSWFVIPGNYFDKDAKGVGTDLNRNGTIDPEETTPSVKYARYNYAIQFKGAIAENDTAMITDPDGTGPIKAYVSDWINKWSYPKLADGSQWQPITYEFDPAYVIGQLDADPTIDPSTPAYKTGPQAGFYMPVANDILYQE